MSDSSLVPQETPLAQRLEQLNRQIGESVQQVVQDLHQAMGESVRQSSQELLRRLEEVRPTIPESFVPAEELTALAPPPASAQAAPTVDQLFEAVGKVDAETGQAEILVALLEQGRRFASRTAFFLVREGQARGWAGRGFEGANPPIEGLSFPVAEIDAWAALVGENVPQYCGAADCDVVAQRASVEAAWAGVVVPFVLRGQLSGIFYADSVEGEGPPEASSLQLLTHAAVQALETASSRGPGGAPALRPARSQ